MLCRRRRNLSALIGTPSELVIRKQLAELDEHMAAFVSRAPFVLLGTVGREGTCDVSPRGDPGAVAQRDGFAHAGAAGTAGESAGG